MVTVAFNGVEFAILVKPPVTGQTHAESPAPPPPSSIAQGECFTSPAKALSTCHLNGIRVVSTT